MWQKIGSILTDPKKGVEFLINHEVPSSLLTQLVCDLVSRTRQKAQEDIDFLKTKIDQLEAPARQEHLHYASAGANWVKRLPKG